jgi:uncharacterized cofD-like protein
MTPPDRTRPARGTSPRVVVMGGGTGIGACLRGLKRLPVDLTAIVTVADDGGSSGRLRKDFAVPPPGDVRNCLVALSEGDPVLARLFDYRFPDSLLKGHSFGNLFLVVLTNLLGSFTAAVDVARDVLSVRGRVLPSTDARVVLVATHPDGTKSTGEQRISSCGRPITALALRPEPPPVAPEIRRCLVEADLVVIGPGSLFTSLVPNLLVPGVTDALAACRGRVILVANIMTEPGETAGMSLEDHVRVLKDVGGLSRLDLILASSTGIDPAAAARYRETGAEILVASPRRGSLRRTPVDVMDLSMVDETGRIRHDPEKLAAAVSGLLWKTKGAPGGRQSLRRRHHRQ